MSTTPEDRRVITFYSYKGGVGRTMSLANVAYRLANTHGLRVIAVDWDLEAPGLHRFFGINAEIAAKTNGILDYFLAWGAAVKRGDAEPPPELRDVESSILPVDDEAHRPRFGSVSLLLAGRQDKSYDERLSHFNWRDLYANEAGAAAVEALRTSLVELADVVLVDSRTGLTDAGGVCAIQIPDGVVLLTAPNEQSLEGTKSIARRISRATLEERAQRPRPKVWLTISRTPSNEESYLAEQWFQDHRKWFDEGVDEGLWLKEDHADGIRTLEIPHVGRWGFGESVLRAGAEGGPRDPLAHAYEYLSETLLRWLRGEPTLIAPRIPKHDVDPQDIPALEAEASNAEARGDVLGLGIILFKLAIALEEANKVPEGIQTLEQAIGIFLSRGARGQQMRALGKLGALLAHERRWKDSDAAYSKARILARAQGNKEHEALALTSMAGNAVFNGSFELAAHLFGEAQEMNQMFGLSADERENARVVYASALLGCGRAAQGVGLLRDVASTARGKGDVATEKDALRVLLDLTAKDPLPDADALRARLAELTAPKPEPT